MKNNDEKMMEIAINAAEGVRCITSPNPWVGCVIVSENGELFEAATYEDGANHAEVIALAKAKSKAHRATMYVTLEPCCHQGKTPPCVEAILSSGIKKVFVGISDPDPKVGGNGISILKQNGVEVEVGLCNKAIEQQLAPYLKHRTSKKPYVVLKLAMTLDGNIADSQGNSKWITSELARADSHRLRAESDVVVVGANTIREDDPSLTCRDWSPEVNPNNRDLNPRRVVLGSVNPGAKVHPCLEVEGDIKDVIGNLESGEVLQILVEGGAQVAREFHESGCVDKYVIYLAPAILGGVGKNIFGIETQRRFAELWRGEIESVSKFGSDIRIDIVNGQNDT